MSIASNAHKSLTTRLEVVPNYNDMTRQSDKHSAAVTLANFNDRYKCALPWSSPLNAFKQSDMREPMNMFGHRYGDPPPPERHYLTAGMFNQIHAGQGAPSLRTKPVRRQFNIV